MKKILLSSVFCLLLLVPSLSDAETKTSTTTVEKTNEQKAYEQCKKSALLKKEKIISSALKEYRTASDQITNRAKINFEIIAWRVPSSYKAEVAKILDEKKKALVSVTANIEKTRKIAQDTWKVEDSLCEFNHSRMDATSTRQTPTKKK